MQFDMKLENTYLLLAASMNTRGGIVVNEICVNLRDSSNSNYYDRVTQLIIGER